MDSTAVQWMAAIVFAIAITHTFSTKFFERLAHRDPRHAGAWHFMAEVEAVFGFWAFVMIVIAAIMVTPKAAVEYLDTRNFTEPMFVFAIMVVAASRAVLHMARRLVETVAGFVPLPGALSYYIVTLSIVPLLGSFITEPAAMTLGALMLRERFAAATVSQKLKYATLGLLFVNISIGGVLTPYAAPPVLMVAGKWNWDIFYMLTHFGWKMALAVTINAVVTAFVFRKELSALDAVADIPSASMPFAVQAIHIVFLAGIVIFAHHPAAFMGLFLFFMGFATAYPQFQDRLILRRTDGRVLSGRTGRSRRAAGLVAGAPAAQHECRHGLLWRHRPHRDYRQCRPHLPRVPGGRVVRGVQACPAGRCDYRRGADRDRQCAQSGRLCHPARPVRRRRDQPAGPAGGSCTAHTDRHSGVSSALKAGIFDPAGAVQAAPREMQLRRLDSSESSGQSCGW